jgi:hypothetical protein
VTVPRRRRMLRERVEPLDLIDVLRLSRAVRRGESEVLLTGGWRARWLPVRDVFAVHRDELLELALTSPAARRIVVELEPGEAGYE